MFSLFNYIVRVLRFEDIPEAPVLTISKGLLDSKSFRTWSSSLEVPTNCMLRSSLFSKIISPFNSLITSVFMDPCENLTNKSSRST